MKLNQYSGVKTKSSILFLITIFALVVSSCVTQKKKGDVSWFKRNYHNLTCRYNYYFNANNMVNETTSKLDAQYRDNYTKVLELFKYTANENVESVSTELDSAVKKLSIAISLHRPSDWVDDCYLLVGKSQYLKKDYESAEETFKYLLQNYNPDDKKVLKNKSKSKKKKVSSSSSNKKKSDTKKKSTSSSKSSKSKSKSKSSVKSSKNKNEESKPDLDENKTNDVASASNENATDEQNELITDGKKPQKYFFKRPPAYQEAKLWLARTMIERKKYDEASTILNELERSGATLKPIRRLIPVIRSYYQLKLKNYDQSIASLQKAIELSKNKNDKTRYSFILGQIYQLSNQNELAAERYEYTKKKSANYELAFNAYVNQLKMAYLSKKESYESVARSLENMVKDSKNKEYRDQIYFGLATIQLDHNQKNDAIANLKKSLEFNTDNKAQKVESYLQLARLYYEAQNYVDAKAYYDSTKTVIAATDDRNLEVQKYSSSLADIAQNIKIIKLQDSLLSISQMSDKDKRDLALKIKKEREKELALNSVKSANKPNTNNISAKGADGSALRPSTFFAYNEKALKKGKKDFAAFWGDRPLEDNWRRSIKRQNNNNSSEPDATVVADVEQTTTNSDELSSGELEEIFKDVPGTPQQIQLANEKIETALLALGKLYRDKIDAYQLSADALEAMNKRYPTSKNELESWYYLNLDYQDLKNSASAKFYYDKILSKYPNTTFARVLSDPNFVRDSKKAELTVNNFYDECYDAFQKGQHKVVTEKVQQAEKQFGVNNPLKARFALLNAMSIGNLQGKDAYISSLKEVIAKYPNSQEEKRAKEILRLLGVDVGTQPNALANGNNDKNTAAKNDKLGNFKVADDKQHYILVLLKAGDDKIEPAKNAISDYNKNGSGNNDRLRIMNLYLDGTTPNSKTPLFVIR
nr:hypothetical protein [Saprospiraceae bacterium]